MLPALLIGLSACAAGGGGGGEGSLSGLAPNANSALAGKTFRFTDCKSHKCDHTLYETSRDVLQHIKDENQESYFRFLDDGTFELNLESTCVANLPFMLFGPYQYQEPNLTYEVTRYRFWETGKEFEYTIADDEYQRDLRSFAGSRYDQCLERLADRVAVEQGKSITICDDVLWAIGGAYGICPTSYVHYQMTFVLEEGK